MVDLEIVAQLRVIEWLLKERNQHANVVLLEEGDLVLPTLGAGGEPEGRLRVIVYPRYVVKNASFGMNALQYSQQRIAVVQAVEPVSGLGRPQSVKRRGLWSVLVEITPQVCQGR